MSSTAFERKFERNIDFFLRKSWMSLWPGLALCISFRHAEPTGQETKKVMEPRFFLTFSSSAGRQRVFANSSLAPPLPRFPEAIRGNRKIKYQDARFPR
jgi:hypothetical protein